MPTEIEGMTFTGFARLDMENLVKLDYSGRVKWLKYRFGLVFLTMILFDLWLRDLNLWRFVSGDFYLDRNTYLLSGPFPWKGTVACLAVAALMLIASVKVLEEREF